jgi:hypothetical protein
VAKQQRERITERSRPTRKVVGEDEIAAPAADLRNPIVIIAGATLALTLVLGMWSFFSAEPVPAAPQAPAVEGLPEGFDLEGLDLDAPPVEIIDGSVEGDDAGEEDPSESEADDAAGEGASDEDDGAVDDAAGASEDEGADASEDDEGASAQEPGENDGENAGEDDGADDEAASDEEAPDAPSDEDGASDEDGG